MNGFAPSSSTRKDHGFSLLELLVVLVIAAIAANLALPRAQPAQARAGLEATAQRLASTLRLARAEGLRTNTDQTVTLDLERKLFWSDIAPTPNTIDKSISVTIHDDGFESAGSSRHIRFQPAGGATGGMIALTDGRTQASVTVDWLTGQTTLVTGH